MCRRRTNQRLHGIPRCTLVLAALVLAVPAGAQSWIAGGSIGVAEQQDYAIGAPVANRDDSDTAFGIFGGYAVSENQLVIASYVDLGQTEYSGPAFGGFTDSLEADGIDISYLAGWNPGSQQRTWVFGSVGVLSWDQDARYTEAAEVFDFRDEGTSFSIGFGANFNLGADGSSPWSLHVAYKLFKNIGDDSNSGHELDREILTIGTAFRFGDGQ